MSSSFYQRKWAGDPHTEKKRLPPEEPSKLQPRKVNKHSEPVVTTNLWQMMGSRKKWYWLCEESWRTAVPCPFTGKKFTTWQRESAAEHVIRRMKGVLLRDKRMGIYWIEDQATKVQLTPEFSNYDCMVNWLVYKGIKSGFIYLDSFIGWDKSRRWRLEKR